MRWIALLFFLAFGGAYLLNRRRGKKRLEQSLEYRFAFSTDEVFHGEYLYLDQVVVNTSEHTVPFLKLETLMPEGLKIVLNPSTEAGKKTGAVHSAESVWMLPPHSQVSRRWRILAEKRGIYPAERVEMHAALAAAGRRLRHSCRAAARRGVGDADCSLIRLLGRTDRAARSDPGSDDDLRHPGI